MKNTLQRVQVIDLFSGCGGMSYGFKTASTSRLAFEVLGGLDTDEHANNTYRRMVGAPALSQDIRALLKPATLRACLAEWGRVDDLPLVLIGCAPCQGFSSHRKKDERKDNRNNLLETFAHIVVALKPDVVLMENVPEMLQKKHWKHFHAWNTALAQAGYRSRTRIYNLATFGVPQERFRALVIASKSRDQIAMPQPLLDPNEFLTVRQAIGDLPALSAGGRDELDPMHVTSKHRPGTVELIRMIPKDGGSRRSLPPGMGPSCLQSVDGFRDVYGRLWWDKPAVAITARCRTPSCGRYAHPEQNRGLSVREAGLLQGFPRDYSFEGPFDDKFKQIGNAVSPVFSKALAMHLDATWSPQGNRWKLHADTAPDIVSPIEKSFSSAIASIKRKIRQIPLTLSA